MEDNIELQGSWSDIHTPSKEENSWLTTHGSQLQAKLKNLGKTRSDFKYSLEKLGVPRQASVEASVGFILSAIQKGIVTKLILFEFDFVEYILNNFQDYPTSASTLGQDDNKRPKPAASQGPPSAVAVPPVDALTALSDQVTKLTEQMTALASSITTQAPAPRQPDPKIDVKEDFANRRQAAQGLASLASTLFPTHPDVFPEEVHGAEEDGESSTKADNASGTVDPVRIIRDPFGNFQMEHDADELPPDSWRFQPHLWNPAWAGKNKDLRQKIQFTRDLVFNRDEAPPALEFSRQRTLQDKNILRIWKAQQKLQNMYLTHSLGLPNHTGFHLPVPDAELDAFNKKLKAYKQFATLTSSSQDRRFHHGNNFFSSTHTDRGQWDNRAHRGRGGRGGPPGHHGLPGHHGTRTCFKCRQPGHLMKDCPNE
jgi:hypothetical protein